MPVYNEKGRYRVKITGALITDQEGKNPQVIIDLQLIGRYDNEYQPNDGDDTYETIDHQPRYAPRVYLSLTDKTMGSPGQPGWVSSLLQFLGFNGNFDEIASITGWEGDAICDYQEYNGTEREKWNIIRPRDPSEQPHQADKTKTRSLNTLFGGIFKKAAEQLQKPEQKKPRATKKKEPEPAMAAPSANGEPTPPTGDDIPF